jgi:hypothetical protein
MRIRMTQTVRGSPDGSASLTYQVDTEHDLSHTPRERELADVFLREGWAVRADAPISITPPPVPVDPPHPVAAPAPAVEPKKNRKGR